MSEIALFGGKAQLPAYMKEGVKSNLAGATFAGASGKSISIKGGVWRLIVDGEEVAKNEDRAMKFVIVNMADAVGRTYYDGPYVEGKDSVPVCWSVDGNTPDPRSANIQSDSCKTCEQNIKGSGAQGDARACRFMRPLAVVLADDMGGDVFRLNLPAMSIFGEAEDGKMPLEAYRKHLKQFKVPIDCVVTEMRFDTNAAVPKLFFKEVRPLEQDEFETCQEQGAKEATVDLVKIEFGREAATAPLPESFKGKAVPKESNLGKKEAAKAAPKVEEPAEEPEVVEAEKPKAKPSFAKKAEPVTDVEDDEPKVRASSKKEEPAVNDLESIVDDWATDD